MANMDHRLEFPDYGEFSLDEQFTSPVQAPTPEPALSYPKPSGGKTRAPEKAPPASVPGPAADPTAKEDDPFPDYELDEYFLELLRRPATEDLSPAVAPAPPSQKEVPQPAAPPPAPSAPKTEEISKNGPFESAPIENNPLSEVSPEDELSDDEPLEAKEAFETGEEDIPYRTEDEQELESRFIRRVAEKDARSPRRKKVEDIPDNTPLPTEQADETVTGKTPRSHSPFFEKLRAPLLRYFATRTAQKELREQEAANWPSAVPLLETPELPPARVVRYYNSLIKPITLRLLLTLVMTIASMWISLGLPMAGQLGQNSGLQAAVCLCFLLASMLAALDIVTLGFRQLFRFYFGMEALAVLSCLFCCVDAVLVMLSVTEAQPYCAVANLSLAIALWGERLFCVSTALNMGTAAGAKGSCILSLETDEQSGLRAVCIQNRPYEGIVRRSEEPDISRRAYSIAAPCLAAAALVLSLLGSLSGDWLGLPHRLSAYFTASCALPAFLSFSLPYLAAAGRLRYEGAAVAGWAGCEELGRNRRIMVTDNDMFPAGSIQIYSQQMEDTGIEWRKQITTYAISLLAAAGSSCLHAFDDIVKSYDCHPEPVEELKFHDGGGISGYIHHENVCIGSAGFMNLNGIRPLQQVDTTNGICVAVGGKFVAVITLSYLPDRNVQMAMRLLSHSRTQPVFAIRDFNITPLMIQNLFGIPAVNFEFPSFKDRFRLSLNIGKPDTPAAAVLVHYNLRSAVACSDRARRLYQATILNTILSILSSALSMLLMFLLSPNGIAVMGIGRLLGYMLLWTVPCLLSSFWVQQNKRTESSGKK